MDYLREELATLATPPVSGGPWAGRVAVGASDMADLIMVVIPGIDARLQVGPCRWQARDATSHPARGDLALVMFDDSQEPWVIAWWPFT